jgi:hypothetical protein
VKGVNLRAQVDSVQCYSQIDKSYIPQFLGDSIAASCMCGNISLDLRAYIVEGLASRDTQNSLAAYGCEKTETYFEGK